MLYVDKEKINYLKKLKDESPDKFKKEFEELKDVLFRKYCSKKNYKKKCDPSYCVFAYTKNCGYLKAINILEKKLCI